MNHRSRRGTGLIPLGFVIQGDGALRVPASIEASPIAFRDWEAAVGTRIASRARPIKLDRGVLLVLTASSTWAQELALLSEAIITALRGRGVAVESLRFRVGQVDAPDRPPSREEVRVSPAPVPLPNAVALQIAQVEDPELRAILANAAAKNLGWQEDNNAPKRERRAAAVKAADEVKALLPRRPAPDAAPTSAKPGARGPRSAS
ncbi:MAG: DUF721 domain-containing protein [Byssovorax sp.]